MKRRWLGLIMVMGLVAAGCATPDSNSGPDQTIQIHGDWTISVYDPDGSLAHHVEFTNNFLGETQLTSVLARTGIVGPWTIFFESSGGTDDPCTDGTAPSSCNLFEPEAEPQIGPSGPHLSYDLSVGPDSSDDGVLVLSGTHIASRDGEIGIVSTSFYVCAPEEGPFPCTITDGGVFTRHFMDSGIPVVEGQLVDISVRISFTTG